MIDYRDKTVWITGASSGIGEALAHAFARRGARLLLSARREEKLRAVAHATGTPHAQVLPLDLDKLDELPEKAREAQAQVGPIDVMVHNAGVGQRSTVLETQFNVVQALTNTNYLAPVALTQALLPSMLERGGGTFVVVSSVLGVFSAPRRAAYAASKHALHGFFEGMRAELSGRGIRILMVCPGRVPSGFQQAALEGDGRPHGMSDPTSYKGVTPAECADKTLGALDRGKDEIVVARWEHLPVVLKRLSPGLLRSVMTRARMS